MSKKIYHNVAVRDDANKVNIFCHYVDLLIVYWEVAMSSGNSEITKSPAGKEIAKQGFLQNSRIMEELK